MPNPEKASVVLCAPSDKAWSMLYAAGGADVMVDVVDPAADVPDEFVTLTLSSTTPLVPGVNAMLSELAPTMIVPLVMLHEYDAPARLGTEAA
jgi:hypothetical protein